MESNSLKLTAESSGLYLIFRLFRQLGEVIHSSLVVDRVAQPTSNALRKDSGHSMAPSSTCIHEVLPTELLQKIFLLASPTLSDLLRISQTCRAWRKLVLNEFLIRQYFAFDDNHRRKGLVKRWSFDEEVDNPTDYPFYWCRLADCFLGKCALMSQSHIEAAKRPKTEFEFGIDRGQNYSVVMWLKFDELGEYRPRLANSFFCHHESI